MRTGITTLDVEWLIERVGALEESVAALDEKIKELQKRHDPHYWEH